MAENKMEQVAHLLGVEMEERFKIKSDYLIHSYLIDNYGILDTNTGAHDDSILTALLIGTIEIIKKPWELKEGETYWYVDLYGKADSGLYGRVFSSDIMRYKLGNCYRTEAEAKAHADEWKRWFESDETVEVLKHE